VTPTHAARPPPRQRPHPRSPARRRPRPHLIDASDGTSRRARPSSNRGTSRRPGRNSNRAVDVLLESPYGGRTEPRIREHFDRLVDRISTYEVRALSTGDGFTEKKYEPASIDELLALSATLGTPAAALTEGRVQSDLETADHDIPIPLNRACSPTSSSSRAGLHDFIEEGMKRGSKYLPMIQSVFRAEGLPLDLAFVPLVESAFKPNALSRAKAKGVGSS
jgi:membrane-bound lytic murein transglycosylase D